MARYDPAKIDQLAKQLAEYATERTPALQPSPRPRIIVPDDFASERPCSTEFAWMCDQIRFLSNAYGFDWLVRQESRGYAGLESMPDGELQRVYKQLGRAIDCRNSGIPFEDTDLIEYDQSYDDPC